MYVRYIVRYHNTETNREETGIFRSADFVRDHTQIGEIEKATLQELITWFDVNLPVPDFYDDPSKRREDDHVYFWFKVSANDFICRMEDLCAIIERHGVEINRLNAEEAPAGDLVFEDHCQIAVKIREDFIGIK